jgi:hypothetical protein
MPPVLLPIEIRNGSVIWSSLVSYECTLTMHLKLVHGKTVGEDGCQEIWANQTLAGQTPTG